MQTLAFTGGLIEGDRGAAALLALKPSALPKLSAAWYREAAKRKAVVLGRE
jgi:hypothetical protein